MRLLVKPDADGVLCLHVRVLLMLSLAWARIPHDMRNGRAWLPRDFIWRPKFREGRSRKVYSEGFQKARLVREDQFPPKNNCSVAGQFSRAFLEFPKRCG